MRAALLLSGSVAMCAACSDGTRDAPVASDGERIACALGGEAEMKPVCTLERVRSGDVQILVVHHPDGAFRRFVSESGGGGLVPADGAAVGTTRVDGQWLELSVDEDRYRLPMSRTDHAPTP